MFFFFLCIWEGLNKVTGKGGKENWEKGLVRLSYTGWYDREKKREERKNFTDKKYVFKTHYHVIKQQTGMASNLGSG